MVIFVVSKRSYDDGCATAHGLDLVGERWALLVVRELLLGPKRFTDLRTGLPGISPNVLAQRLRDLEQAGVLRRGKLGPPAAAWVYELTEWGFELEPVIIRFGRWACRSPQLPQNAPMGPDSIVLALKTLFDPGAARGFSATFMLVLAGEHYFRVSVTRTGIEVARERVDRPDVIVETTVSTLKAMLWGGLGLTEALRARDVLITGDRASAERFLTLFPVPEPVSVSTGT